ncbi:MAG: hypothetical protein JWO31_4278 [Phycisphaerales bacterium]|nr:hypothetical protein [Phycisphaerales bacterium]
MTPAERQRHNQRSVDPRDPLPVTPEEWAARVRPLPLAREPAPTSPPERPADLYFQPGPAAPASGKQLTLW